MSSHTAISVVLVALLLTPPSVLALRWAAGRWPMLGNGVPRIVPHVSVSIRGGTAQRDQTARVTVDEKKEPVAVALGGLDVLRRQELYELARLRGVAGRSRMSRQELIDALTDLDAAGSSSARRAGGSQPGLDRR
jgi:hypothetical protein